MCDRTQLKPLYGRMILAGGCGDLLILGLFSGSGKSPGEGNGNLLQYYARETPWIEKPGRLQSKGSKRSQTQLSY